MTTNTIRTCIIACGKSATCQVVYASAVDTCMMCDFGLMTSNPRGEMVAATVDGFACPAGVVDRTTFVNFTAPLQSEISNSPSNSEGTSTSLTTSKPSPSCPESYYTSLRPNNIIWCQKVYLAGENSLEAITQGKVQSICAENNSILTGLETMDELTAAMEQLEKLSETFDADVNLWIDGVYNPECFGITTPNCTGVNAFNFTDPYLQNFAGYDWSRGEPNPYKPEVPYCLYLMYPHKKDDRLGKVAIFGCKTRNLKALPSAVLCGSLATRLMDATN